MWRRFKLFLQFSFGILISLLVMSLGISKLSESSLDLKSTVKLRGQVASKGRTGKTFSFTLTDVPASFWVYRASRNYDYLNEALAVGDSLTVYFPQTNSNSIQAYQIEKGGQVLVGKDLLEGQNKAGGIICIIGGIVMIGATFWGFRKRKYRFWRSRHSA
jgi:hypothetical protein